MTGPGGATITYSLYRNAARDTVWGDTTGTNTLAGTGTGAAQQLTVYGRVPPQNTPAPGTYTDTVTATITY
ncbi:spore Coat Protein U domain protein [Brucella thiophenivorans]|uniref:Spore Coat Protein U domain protein n=2 Tax=Brucella thiophenivorans TaxID=571255 RepID=A0A256FYA3_9HYPH|nr:spore Coat Protein U domain protein [Brucella thiophenivorans]